MLTVRRSAERGRTNFEWLDSHHSFSFGDYFDRNNMAFHSLRVINEDFVAGGGGFPTHPHRDMEIITYILSGALEHRDSMGTSSVIRAGEVQKMSAGRGVTHSEFNHSKDEPVHLLQIWIMPERKGLQPSYDQRDFSAARGDQILIGSRDGRDGSIQIVSDVDLYLVRPAKGSELPLAPRPARALWLQVVTGSASVGAHQLAAGDAVALEGEPAALKAGADFSAMLFDLDASAR